MATSLCREDLLLLVARAKDWNVHPAELAVYMEILTDDEKRALTDPDHPFWERPGYRMFKPKREDA